MATVNMYWGLYIRDEKLIYRQHHPIVDQTTLSVDVELEVVKVSGNRRNNDVTFEGTGTALAVQPSAFVVPEGNVFDLLSTTGDSLEFLQLLRICLKRQKLHDVVVEAMIEIEDAPTKYQHRFSFASEVKILRHCHPLNREEHSLSPKDKTWKEEAREALGVQPEKALLSFFREQAFIALQPLDSYTAAVYLMEAVECGRVIGYRKKAVGGGLFRSCVGVRATHLLKKLWSELAGRAITFDHYEERLKELKEARVSKDAAQEMEQLRQRNRELLQRILQETSEKDALKKQVAELKEQVMQLQQRLDDTAPSEEMLTTATGNLDDLDDYDDNVTIADMSDVAQTSFSTAYEESDMEVDIEETEEADNPAETFNSINAELERKVLEARRKLETTKKNDALQAEDPAEERDEALQAGNGVEDQTEKSTEALEAGDRVMALENGIRYEASIIMTCGETAKVHWKGYGKEWDSELPLARCQKIQEEEYHIGMAVEVFEKKYNAWYTGEVTGFTKTGVKVYFPEYHERKTVTKANLRKVESV